jgi:hypothetical protein
MPIQVVSNSDAVTVTGPLIVQSDPMGAATTLSFDNGNVTTDGSGNVTMLLATVKGIQGGVANGGATTAAQSMTTSGTISNGANRVYRILAGATASNLTLTKGTVDGQDLTLVNVSATAATITGNVAAAVTVAVSTASSLEWDAGLTLWFHKA